MRGTAGAEEADVIFIDSLKYSAPEDFPMVENFRKIFFVKRTTPVGNFSISNSTGFVKRTKELFRPRMP